MSRKIKAAAAGVMVLILTAGLICCVLRPSYVREAVGILLSNELSFTQEEIGVDEKTP